MPSVDSSCCVKKVAAGQQAWNTAGNSIGLMIQCCLQWQTRSHLRQPVCLFLLFPLFWTYLPHLLLRTQIVCIRRDSARRIPRVFWTRFLWRQHQLMLEYLVCKQTVEVSHVAREKNNSSLVTRVRSQGLNPLSPITLSLLTFLFILVFVFSFWNVNS